MIRKLMLICVAFAFVSCVNLNITVNFPTEELKGQIEEDMDDVWGTPETEDENGEEAADDDETSWLPVRFHLSFAPRSLWAEDDDDDIDMSKTNAKIRKIKERMKERVEDLKKYKDDQRIGEGRKGLLQIRDEEGLKGKEKAKFRKLREDENDDREEYIEELARINDVEEDEIGRVWRLFVLDMRKRAKKKWLIQDDDKEWLTKEAWEEKHKDD